MPGATRWRRPGWRDPRLVIGVVVVAASVVLGARVLAAADDSVPVWTLARDLPAGSPVTGDVLESRPVRFGDAADADRYLSAIADLPEGAALARDVGRGELLPRSALRSGAPADLVQVPLSVAADDLPATVSRGGTVDVWVAAANPDPTADAPEAQRVLVDVEVVSVPATAQGLAPESTRQVIVGVPRDRAGDLGEALGRLATGRVVVVGKD